MLFSFPLCFSYLSLGGFAAVQHSSIAAQGVDNAFLYPAVLLSRIFHEAASCAPMSVDSRSTLLVLHGLFRGCVCIRAFGRAGLDTSSIASPTSDANVEILEMYGV